MSTPDLPDVSACQSHRDAMLQIVRACSFERGAELGLGSGHLASVLLTNCPSLTLIGVDMMRRADRARRLRELVRRFEGRFRLYEMRTGTAAARIMDRTLDFVFIDAGHSFEAVHSDIHHWHRKVRPGGWLLGHDYGHPEYTGVQQAVDRWFGCRVRVLEHTIWAVPADAMHAEEPA